MIYYHCNACKARQSPGHVACWRCKQKFPRPVPIETPLVVVVDRETKDYAVYDGLETIDMRVLPPKYARRAIGYGKGCYRHPQAPTKPNTAQAGKNADAFMYVVVSLSISVFLGGLVWAIVANASHR